MSSEHVENFQQKLRQLQAEVEVRQARGPLEGLELQIAEDLLCELQVHQIELELQNEDMRQTHIALEESRDRYVDLYELAPIGYLTVNNHGMIAEVNWKTTALFGVNRKQLNQHLFETFVANDDKARWQRQFISMKSLATGQGLDFDLMFMRHDGVMFHAHLNCVKMDDGEEHPILRITLVDNTQLKQAEAKLIQSESLSRAVIEASPVPLALNDELGNITFLNAAFTEAVGYTISDIPTLAHWWPRAYPDPQYRQWAIDEWQKNLQEAKRSNRPFSPIEINIQCKNGSVGTFIGSAATLTGNFSGTHLVILYDITARRHAKAALQVSEAHLRLSQIGGGIGTWEADLVNNTQTWSENCSALLGFPAHNEPTYEDFLALVLPEDRQRVIDATQLHIEKDVKYDVEYRVIAANGSIRWMRSAGQAERNVKGQAITMRGIAQDITERKVAEDALRIAATVFESQEGMLVTDANNVILRVNQAFTLITGYTAEEAVGKTPHLLSSGQHNAKFYAEMWASINGKGAWDGEIWNQRKSGEIYPEHLAVTAVKDMNGVVTNYVATLTDITMNKAAAAEIHHLAFYDSLTRLPNRRLLVDRLNHALAASARLGWGGALLFLDLDHFKSLNDTLGHDVGDLLLQQVATRLSACVREGDTVARLGGDEFVVMLEDLSKQTVEAAAQAETIANKILTMLSQPYNLGTHDYQSTSSIGVVLFGTHIQVQEDLLKHADIAMYQAKKAGGNTLRFFDPQMQDVINTRVDLERDLRKALDKQQFQLYYQVQVNSTGKPMGAEALIRWIHPERGLISPFNFIPLAEDTGLILPVGHWVLETACAQLNAWQKSVLTRDLTLSINVSAKQFRQANFVEEVQAAVQHHAINPERLKLELTESMLIDNVQDIIASMSVLNEIGVRFELDDFGTGYSSLQYLKCLPLHQLKIDQSFVRDLAVDVSDQAIVRTIIVMAQSLELEVIAEGVETEEQRQLLLRKGCTHYQGYLFGKPVPIEQFEAALIH